MTPERALENVMSALKEVVNSARSHCETVIVAVETGRIPLDEGKRLFGDLTEEFERGIDIGAADYCSETPKRVIALQTAHIQTCAAVVAALEKTKKGPSRRG